MKVVLVALAGAAGALTRWGIGSVVGTRSFPWATLAVNVAGSFALGWVLAGDRWSVTATTAVTVGFLGAFTTFSTFAFEATSLARDDRAGTAFLYVAASMALGLLAAAGGWRLGRSS